MRLWLTQSLRGSWFPAGVSFFLQPGDESSRSKDDASKNDEQTTATPLEFPCSSAVVSL